MEEQRVLSDRLGKLFIGVDVHYEHAALLSDEMIVNLENVVFLEFFEVLEFQREQLRPFLRRDFLPNLLNDEEPHFTHFLEFLGKNKGKKQKKRKLTPDYSFFVISGIFQCIFDMPSLMASISPSLISTSMVILA